MIVGKAGEFGDQPGHEINADRRYLARGSGSEELPPALGAAIKNGDAKVLKVRPGRDLSRPYGLGDELRRDHQSVPAQPVVNQLGQRRERGRSFAGAKRRNQERRVVLVEPGSGALLVRIEDARKEGGVHRSAALALV